MKQFFFKFVATFRCYSTKPTYHSTKWKAGSKKKLKSRNEEFTATTKRPRIKWTDEQLQVLDAVSTGKSVFVTGSAGTGKTALMLEVIRRLRKMYGKSKVAVTASTGTASCALHGLTLHCFAGTGIGDKDVETLLLRVLSNRWAFHKWEKVEALVIDECSMIHADYFDKLERIARSIRGGSKVWGGIQLVVGGDFFQLPPILPKQQLMEKEFVFEADCWNASFDLQIELKTIFRQSETLLVKLLQGIRRGEIDNDELKILEQRCNSTAAKEDTSAVQLFPRIEDVERVNQQHLLSLDEDIVTYTALDSGEKRLKSNLKLGIAPDQLDLCLGARVILCKNLDVKHKLVNGATGTIIDFRCDSDNGKKSIDPDIDFICESGSLIPVVKFDSGQELEIGPQTWSLMDAGKIVAQRKQIPLMLAWALSIHKSQGMTIDRLRTDLRRAFGYGMVYVALSRVKTLDGLDLIGFSKSKIKAHPKVLQFYKEHFL
ncbi:hypothetical protein M9H77_21321 [Catharanthus roseus]|uniref:Uncharacterized protein n=1 Tax=Catharanthus roseus TaxID=4058 RepID=A0ACC0APX9_CATRO|nr:hypothetical protein M9H77_21321 [Catharanthus roseus]